MERYTQRDRDGKAVIHGDSVCSDWGVPEGFRGDAIGRLAAYIDTGVEIGERFRISGVTGTWSIQSNGQIESDCGAYLQSGLACNLINHHDCVLRKPRFTQEEVAVLRAVKVSYPWAKYIVRSVVGLYFSERKPTFTKDECLSSGTSGRFTGLPDKLFLSVQQGKTASLEDFI